MSTYFTSSASNPAQSGVLRLATTDSISWRNNANSADIALAKNNSDALTYNGNVLFTAAGAVPTTAGGTGLSSGTAGGVVYFSNSTTLASSGALTANQLVLGGGSGSPPSSLAAGSQYQVLVMGASNPGYGQVNLSQSAAVTGTLPVGGGGTGLTTTSQNFAFIGPTSGSGAPTWRALVAGDIPTLNQNTTGTAANITGTSNSTLTSLSALTTASILSTVGTITTGIWEGSAVGIGYGGTGATTQQAAINALTGTQSAGTYLRSNGTNATLSSIQAGDVPTLNQNTTGTASNVTATSNSTLTTLSALATASSLSTVGTITTGTWAGTTISKTHGGTGATTAGASGVPTAVALTFGTNVSIDASTGNFFTLTATGNCTINAPSNPIAGQKIIIAFLSSGGSFTPTLASGAGGFSFGTSITTLNAATSGTTDYIGCIYNSGANLWHVVGYVKGY